MFNLSRAYSGSRGGTVHSGMSLASRTLDLASRLPETRLDRGLTVEEFEEIEARFGLRFPPDLREFLSLGLPVGKNWPEWRSLEHVRERIAWPLEGMLFDIEHNGCWDPIWGDRPGDLRVALEVARAAVNAAPVLIPVYGHRYMPGEPTEAGNPVLSVFQTDIIPYGRDLLTYFLAECNGRSEDLCTGERTIRSWTRWMTIDWRAQ